MMNVFVFWKLLEMYASLRRPIDGQPIHGVITNVGDSISTAHDEAVFHLTYTFVLNSTTYKGTSRHTGYAYDARSRIGVTFLSTNPSISEFTGSHGAFG